MQNIKELTGLSHPKMEHDPEDRPMAMYWMTNEMINETMHVWSPIYGRNISQKEAVVILRNIKNLIELLSETWSEK